MAHNTQCTLKEEIETYLRACGLFETLEVFRKEYQAKSDSVDSDFFKIKKSSFAKRYYENKAEIREVQRSIQYAMKELENSIQKLSLLHVKFNLIADMCSKHVAFNLELVNAIEAKFRSFYSANKEQFGTDNLLDSENLYETLAKKIFSIYCGKDSIIKEQNCRQLLTSNGSNSQIDCTTLKQANTDNPCSRDNLSDFQIISDNELKNIHPLDSLTSLTEFRDESMADFNNSRTVLSSGRANNMKIPLKNSLCNVKPVTSNTHKKFLNSSCELCLSHAEIHSCESTCSSSCSVRSFQTKNSVRRGAGVKDPDLRSWCEEFLNVPSTSEQNAQLFDSNYFLDGDSSVPTTAETGECSVNTGEDYMSGNIFHTVAVNSKPLLTGEVSVDNNSSSKGSSCLTLSTRNASSGALNQSPPFWKEFDFTHNNLNANESESGVNDVLELWNNESVIESSHNRDTSNDQNVTKNFFSDTYLAKSENKMVDKKTCSIEFLKTPLMEKKGKKCESSICSIDQGQVPDCDLGSPSSAARTGSHWNTFREKESRSCNGTPSRGSFPSLVEAGRKNINLKSTSLDIKNDCRFSNMFCNDYSNRKCKDECIKPSSVSYLGTSNSAVVDRKKLHKNIIEGVCFEVPKEDNAFMPDVPDYVFKKFLKSFDSSSVVEPSSVDKRISHGYLKNCRTSLNDLNQNCNIEHIKICQESKSFYNCPVLKNDLKSFDAPLIIKPGMSERQKSDEYLKNFKTTSDDYLSWLDENCKSEPINQISQESKSSCEIKRDSEIRYSLSSKRYSSLIKSMEDFRSPVKTKNTSDSSLDRGVLNNRECQILGDDLDICSNRKSHTARNKPSSTRSLGEFSKTSSSADRALKHNTSSILEILHKSNSSPKLTEKINSSSSSAENKAKFETPRKKIRRLNKKS